MKNSTCEHQTTQLRFFIVPLRVRKFAVMAATEVFENLITQHIDISGRIIRLIDTCFHSAASAQKGLDRGTHSSHPLSVHLSLVTCQARTCLSSLEKMDHKRQKRCPMHEDAPNKLSI